MEYEKTKEDLNARRLDKILQNGLTGSNMEMESSVETHKGYSNFSQHSFQHRARKGSRRLEVSTAWMGPFRHYRFIRMMIVPTTIQYYFQV